MVETYLFDLFYDGDVEEVKKYLEEHPSFNVNANILGYELGSLHVACYGGNVNVSELLIAHTQINVNRKSDSKRQTPFSYAFSNRKVEVVKILLRDSRVDINMADDDGCTPLWWTSYYGYVDVIKWMIASGRDIDLDMKGKRSSSEFTAIEIARKMNNTEIVTLLERFSENQAQTRHEIRAELGLVDAVAAELFAMTVFLCDDYLAIRKINSNVEVTRFFKIISRLPMELQMMTCYRVYESTKEIILSMDSEPAFKFIARAFVD